MTILVGGGGGVGPAGPAGPDIAGLTADGGTPAGILVAGVITAGTHNAGVPQYQQLTGNLTVLSEQADLDDGDGAAGFQQTATLAGNSGIPTVNIDRYITRGAHHLTGAVLQLVSGGDAPEDGELIIDGPNFKTNFAGGLGRFNHAAPTAASAITGALSTVVDPAAKAVLTSIIAALLADGGCTNGTT